MNGNKTTWLILIVIIMIIGFGLWYFLKGNQPPATPAGFTGLSPQDLDKFYYDGLTIYDQLGGAKNTAIDIADVFFEMSKNKTYIGKMSKEQVTANWDRLLEEGKIPSTLKPMWYHSFVWLLLPKTV